MGAEVTATKRSIGIALLLLVAGLVCCSEPAENRRHYYIHPHGPVEMAQKLVFEGAAPEDAILLTEEEYLGASFHDAVEGRLDTALDFDRFVYIFAFVPFSVPEEEVDMEFDTVDGEGSTHVFTIDGEDAASTSRHALFIWRAHRVG